MNKAAFCESFVMREMTKRMQNNDKTSAMLHLKPHPNGKMILSPIASVIMVMPSHSHQVNTNYYAPYSANKNVYLAAKNY